MENRSGDGLAAPTAAQSNREIIQACAMFSELAREELLAIEGLSRELTASAGELVIREGDRSHDVFIVKTGAVEVIKASGAGLFRLVLLEPGSCIGEMAVVEREVRRSASVRATQRTTLLRIDFDAVFEREDFRAIHFKITTGIAKELSRKMRYANDVTVRAMRSEIESNRARIAFGVFAVYLMAVLSLYTLALRALTFYVQQVGDSTPVTVGIASIFAVCVLLIIRRSGYPAEVFGLTLRNGRKVLLESLAFTLPVLALLVAAKLVLILAVPRFHGRRLLDFADLVSRLGTGSVLRYFLFLLLYTIFSPIQEFIARGGIQSSFQSFLPESRGRVWVSIILSNLLFSTAHSHLNLIFAVVAFVPGLFWGWMYYRQRSLLGVCVSHVLIGDFAIYVLGFSSSFFAARPG